MSVTKREMRIGTYLLDGDDDAKCTVEVVLIGELRPGKQLARIVFLGGERLVPAHQIIDIHWVDIDRHIDGDCIS